jgi:hypothetical protein
MSGFNKQASSYDAPEMSLKVELNFLLWHWNAINNRSRTKKKHDL